MSLTSALNTAKSALAATQTQTALVSRNIANVNTEGATRKYANVVTGSGGRVEVRSIAQSSNSVLYRNMLDSTAALAKSGVVTDGLTRIDEMIGDIENGSTPAALLGTFSDKLKAYAALPTNHDFARAAADAAQDLVTALKQGSETVDTIRRDADDELVNAAADMTRLLASIEKLNREVVSGTNKNEDVTDIIDQRDQAVAALAQYVGVTAQTRGANDLVLYTDSGVTLFDKIARTVSFQPTHPLVDGEAGNGFRIDGTLVTGENAVMPIKTGKVAGLVQLRDDVAVTYQSQLDEIARGLIAATVETDGPPVTVTYGYGIFASASGLPAAADAATAGLTPGLAKQIQVASGLAMNPEKIRDGVSHNYNTTPAAAGFATRINATVTALSGAQAFHGGGNVLAAGTLADFAASSVSWLQENRSEATSDTDYKRTLLDRTKETLSNETGINLDQETLLLLDLERSYQASSKILSTVDEMIKTLLNSI